MKIKCLTDMGHRFTSSKKENSFAFSKAIISYARVDLNLVFNSLSSATTKFGMNQFASINQNLPFALSLTLSTMYLK